MAEIPPINQHIITVFRRIAHLYTIGQQIEKHNNASAKVIADIKRRALSYSNAVKSLSGWYQPLTLALRAAQIPGIGESSVKDIHEIIRDGTSSRLEQLEADYGVYSDAMDKFMAYDRIGKVKALKLVLDGYLDISQVPEDQLTKAQRLGIAHHDTAVVRIERSYIEEVESQLLFPVGTIWKIAGSYRRGCATSGDIDILLANITMGEAIAALPEWLLGDIIVSGEKVTQAYTRDGKRLDLKIVPADIYPYALFHATGSDAFNVKIRGHARRLGYTLCEYGLFPIDDTDKDKTYLVSVAAGSERDIFTLLGLQYVAPANRLPTTELVPL